MRTGERFWKGAGGAASGVGRRRHVVDGDAEKPIAPLRGHRGAAPPDQAVVVYDPDSGLALDMVAGEDAHQTERVLASALLSRAEAGQVWVSDRHFCARALLEGWAAAGACFVEREHANHPRVAERGPWRDGGRVETGTVREQAITVEGHATPWRCVELCLDVPTEAGDTAIRIWNNLPASVSAGQIARAYQHRWSIEGLFGRLERVLHSEICSLGQPRAACLAFAAAVLAYNVLSLVARCVARARAPASPVSLFHLAVHMRSGFEGLLIALPSECWPGPVEGGTAGLAERLLQLARRIDPKRVAAFRRGPETEAAQGYVDGRTARAHVATARVMAKARLAPGRDGPESLLIFARSYERLRGSRRCRIRHLGSSVMRSIILSVAALALLGSVGTASAGCMAGAAAGGVAGHMAGHHGLLGAAAGCAVGHHMAKKKK